MSGDISPLVTCFQPEHLEDPVLVMVCGGWVDAAGSANACRERLRSPGTGRLIARFDADRLLDHRARRPTVHLVDGVSRRLEWPAIELHLVETDGDRDILLLDGPEPDHEWRGFAASVVDLCHRLGVDLVVGLGAYPAAVPHTRPTRLSCTASSPDLTRELDFVTATLEVPAGIQAVIEVEAARSGIRAVGIWAQVPHYLSTSSYPPASLALLEAFTSLTDCAVDVGPLSEKALATRARLDDLVTRNPDHVTMLEQLEVAYDDLHDLGSRLPSGDDLAAELERYLRNRDD